jgi:Tat protein secretion system quality control protein TatD with DNase activity
VFAWAVHAAAKCVKGRNEPCHIVAVAEVVAGVLGVSLEEVQRVTWDNTMRVFTGLDRKEES